MEDYKYDFDTSELDDIQEDNYQDEKPEKDKTITGYRVVIGVLAVVLVAMTVLYFNIHREQQAEYDSLSLVRDDIANDLSAMITDFDSLEMTSAATNDSLNFAIAEQSRMADSIIGQLKNERRLNYNKLREYENQVNTMRTIMKGYLRQIDSLSNLNDKLAKENVGYRKKISEQELRAEKAEERAEELDNMVKQGSVLRARSIAIATLNDKGKEVSRAKRADRLRVDFAISANEFAEPGNVTVYVRIISPDGFALITSAMPTFENEGQQLTYSASRTVDYQNVDLPVSIYYDGKGFLDGTYRVELYANGYQIASAKVNVE